MLIFKRSSGFLHAILLSSGNFCFFSSCFLPKECYWKVPPSNFFCTVIFNFDYVFFLAFIAILLKFISSHWVSATKESLSWSQNGQKTPLLWPTNESFVALTQCNELVLRKWPKLLKKVTWSKLKIPVIRKYIGVRSNLRNKSHDESGVRHKHTHINQFAKKVTEQRGCI